MAEMCEPAAVLMPPADMKAEDEEKKKENESVRIRVSVFFDGTLNNRTNVEHRKADSEIYAEYEGEGSFENDLTNVAIMEKTVEKACGFDISLATYIEGPGTEDNEGDSSMGAGIGMGSTGVTAKVKKGLEDVVAKIKAEAPTTDKVIELIELDVFGFSRGAAGARNFIYEALWFGEKPLTSRLTDAGYSVFRVRVNFAGLYDTVSSHGLNFNNDTGKLKLSSVRFAKKVVQLAAAEEHRKNFSLTNIKSVRKDRRLEIFLPGVHSDIGGGYVDGSKEEIIVYSGPKGSRLENERKRLIAAGWYTPQELRVIDLARNALLKGTRLTVKNSYSRIPLHIMAKYARESGININPKLESANTIPGGLNKIKQRIEQYIASGKPSKPEDWQHNDQDLAPLRHDYLHFSAHYSFGMKPRFVNYKRTRKILYG